MTRRVTYQFDDRARQRLIAIAGEAREMLTDEERAEYLPFVERNGDYLSWMNGEDGDVLLVWSGVVLVTLDEEAVTAILREDNPTIHLGHAPSVPDDLSSLDETWEDPGSDSAGNGQL